MKRTILDLDGYRRTQVECCATCMYAMFGVDIVCCAYYKNNSVEVSPEARCNYYHNAYDNPVEVA